MMNICLISTGYPPEDGGGIGTYIHNLALGLKERGHKVLVITKTAESDCVETIEGIEVHRYKFRYYPKIERFVPGLAWSKFIAKKVIELDKLKNFDIIEFPNWEGVGCSYVKQRPRKPIVTRIHTPYFETLIIDAQNKKVSYGDRMICRMEEQACKASEQLVSSTVNHCDFVAQKYQLDKDKVAIIPLGIKLVANGHAPVSKQNGQLKILFVSRLEKRKGATTFLQAIPHILKRVPQAEFIIIGKDRPHAPGGITHQEYFNQNFGQYKDKVKFYGFISNEELDEHYRNADIFVVPSVYESFGLIYVEAMMHGKPVVGCKTGGIPEVVEDGKTGFLVEPENTDQLVEATYKLLTDEALRVQFGKNARVMCEAKFSNHIMAKNTEKLYEQTIKRFGAHV